MSVISAIIYLAGGLVILWKSADVLVKSAVKLAERLGVSPLVIGLTVVAMGTSAPEVAASIAAALRGAGDAAVGNVYGSNIANLALVAGLAVLIRPAHIQKRTLRYEIPIMVCAALLLWPVVANLYLSRAEGAGLLAVFAALILLTVCTSRNKAANSPQKPDVTYQSPGTKKNVLFIVLGLAGLALGADIAVRGAVFIGYRLGLSEAVIGLTIIAVGTSLPELATSVTASIKGQHDISIGNLVGSNIFNTLLVTGAAGLVRPFTIVSRLAGTDYWIMIIVSCAFGVAALVGRRVIGRISGTLLLCGYVAYMVYLLAYSG
ncbi:MAG TPA: calcium/sodium antiporter [Sedimentisphaerales bacterium]|nr:calcium/sodium antiporter [Sedimentisphaerales bacterium]